MWSRAVPNNSYNINKFACLCLPPSLLPLPKTIFFSRIQIFNSLLIGRVLCYRLSSFNVYLCVVRASSFILLHGFSRRGFAVPHVSQKYVSILFVFFLHSLVYGFSGFANATAIQNSNWNHKLFNITRNNCNKVSQQATFNRNLHHSNRNYARSTGSYTESGGQLYDGRCVTWSREIAKVCAHFRSGRF